MNMFVGPTVDVEVVVLRSGIYKDLSMRVMYLRPYDQGLLRIGFP